MNKFPYALVGIIIILTSCSRHTQVNCPSFKENHTGISWSFDLPKIHKNKSDKILISPKNMAVAKTLKHEDVRLDILTTRPASAESYASAEASVLTVSRSYSAPTENRRQKFIKKGLASLFSHPGRISSMTHRFERTFQNFPDFDPCKIRTRLNPTPEILPFKFIESNSRYSGKPIMKSQEPDERKTNKMALAGFLLTMAGFLFTIILLPELGLFLVALGMVFCVIGLIQILSNKKKWSGIKLAVAGLVIGTLLILGIIILIALYLG